MSETKEYLSAAQTNGTIHIAEEVIASIAALAASEIEGVCGLSANLGSDLAEMLGVKNLGKGVKLEIVGDDVTIDCNVVVLYGYSVLDVAKSVQERVASSVESTTGMHVKQINVNICGISLPKEAKK